MHVLFKNKTNRVGDRGEYPAHIACNLFYDGMDLYVAPTNPRIVQEYGTTGQEPSFIRDITASTVIGFKYFDFRDVKGIRLKTRGYAGGYFEVLRALDDEVLARVDVDYKNIWTVFESKFEPENGVSPLYLRYQGDGTAQLLSFELLH